MVPFHFSRRNGNIRPPKLEPPPVQPTSRSGVSPILASWSNASSPMIVWCSSTWFSTLPSAYFVSGSAAATSTASLIAMPSEPGESGCAARIARPAAVRSDGLGWMVPPNVSIIIRRYGFWSYDARTCQTSHSSPNWAQAKASAVPHCPAPVSVVSRRTPAAAL